MTTDNTNSANDNLTTEQIEAHLAELGETGTASVRGDSLYTRREENCDERYCGKVNHDHAYRVVEDWFLAIANESDETPEIKTAK